MQGLQFAVFIGEQIHLLNVEGHAIGVLQVQLQVVQTPINRQIEHDDLVIESK